MNTQAGKKIGQDSIATTIGQRIAVERNKKGLGQDGAALKFGVSRQKWNRMENASDDNFCLPCNELIKICKEWNISADYLLGIEKTENSSVSLEGIGFYYRANIKAIIDGLRNRKNPS